MDDMGHKDWRSQVRRERLTDIIVARYNFIADKQCEEIEEVPTHVIEAFMMIEYKMLITPLVIRDLKAGLSYRMLTLRYKVTKYRIEKIARRAGLCSTNTV